MFVTDESGAMSSIIESTKGNTLVGEINDVELLRELVRTPSYEGVNECQSIIRAHMEKLGLEMHFLPENPTSNNLNVIGILRGKHSGKAPNLMFIAHADTVPPGPVARWKHGIFEGSVVDGKMFGRGVYDDKAGLVLMLKAAERLVKDGSTLDGDVLFASVSDDESSGKSFKLLAERFSPDACLVLDGAKLHTVAFAHAGCAWYSLEVKGSTTSCNNKASNAIEKTILVINKLLELAASFNDNISEPYACYAKPARLNISKIAGGDWLGNNAAQCSAEFSLNFIPPHTLEEVDSRVKAIVEEVCVGDEWLSSNPPVLEQVHMAFDPYEASLQSPFFELLSITHKQATGESLKTCVVTGWFHGAALGCPAFLYGPGNGGGSHGVDEFFELDGLRALVPPIVELSRKWCLSPV